LLSNIGFEINRGEFMLLCGPSGCGKTTLLRLLKPGLEPKGDLSGGVVFKGEPITALTKTQAASKIGLVMQNPDSQIVCDTVSRELAFGLECLGTENAVMSKRVAETVSYFGIEKLYNKKTYELSGGEKQLVVLASIMAMRPELLLLDEPSSRLDPIAARDLYDLLHRLNLDLGTTIILTEHRIDEVFSLADKVAVMYAGRIVESAPARQLYGRPAHPYTRGLMASVPRLDGDTSRRLVPIEGQPPDLSTLPEGCSFAPRCKLAFERCRRERPALEPVGPNHLKACFADVSD